MSVDIVWQDPPEDAAGDNRYRSGRPADTELIEFATVLAENPGRWACHPRRFKRPEAMSHAITRGRIVAFTPAGDFEAVCRERIVYVRYLGDGS